MRPGAIARRPASADWRIAAAIVLALVLGGCARPGPEVLRPIGGTVQGAKTVTVAVATTRARAASGSNVFTVARARQTNYASFTISVPPGHRPGKVEWARGRPNPAKHFVTVDQSILDQRSFARDVARRAAQYPGHRVGVLVHGYNTNFQEALFRLAQMSADTDMKAAPVLFAWPSEARLNGYVADKDAVTYSRDSLVQMLTALTREPGTGRITVFAHSMGTWLTMEALRQLRLTGRNDVIRRLEVVLAAPDIDVDVFAEQLKVIGPMSPPLTLLVSPDDRALGFSSRIAGDRERVGRLNVADPRVQAAARSAHVEVIDISAFKGSDGLNHDRYVGLASAYPHLVAEAADNKSFQKAGAYVLDTVGVTLSSPFVYSSRALAGR
ncbi:alpha/beta fold hydrolase [Methyloligella sp. GL2]|nr:alpha/beta fold hydrolase [Methyloligella sp. GL2]